MCSRCASWSSCFLDEVTWDWLDREGSCERGGNGDCEQVGGAVVVESERVLHLKIGDAVAVTSSSRAEPVLTAFASFIPARNEIWIS